MSDLNLAKQIFDLWPGGRLFGVRCQQSFSGIYLLERLLQAFPFKTILEYGTGHGALAVYLACWAEQNDLEFYTVEKAGGLTDTKVLLAMLGHRVVVQDCQAVETAAWLATKTPAPRLWIIDNGNKPLEAKIVSSVAGAADLLAVHDYGTEMGDARIPKGWCKMEPWQSEADTIGSRFLLLRKEDAVG